MAVLVFGCGSLAAPKDAGAIEAFTYAVESRGEVTSDVERFGSIAAATLNDRRGWALDGRAAFRRVSAGGQFRLILATPSEVAAAGRVCSLEWSCRVGDQVLINEQRWNEASEAWTLSLDEYQSYVINHEVGHWLGLGHRSCPEVSQPAPVMQQQSISLEGCQATVWPLAAERRRVAAIWSIPVRPRVFWPLPIPRWFWPWARWYLNRGEFADEPPQSPETRPTDAPAAIPQWAWTRLRVVVGDRPPIRMRPWPIPVPQWFWPWARWYLNRGEFADEPPRQPGSRPAASPTSIPAWAWVRLRLLVSDEAIE